MKETRSYLTPRSYFTPRSYTVWLMLALLCAASVVGSRPAQAQDIPPQRQIRGYIPPDQLVSFRPETPFNQFVEFLNPIVERVTTKQIIDPDSRSMPIGVSISGMHFFDALDLVLRFNGLTYRETDRFFLVEVAPEAPDATIALPGQTLAAAEALPATIDSREVQINAVLFSVNRSKARDLGIDWNVFFGGETAAGGGSGGAGGSGAGADGGDGTSAGVSVSGTTPRFFVKTDDIARSVDDFLIFPRQFDVATLSQFFRLIEREGAGETIANPSVTVQSGEEGRIQIGTDLPFVTRDFSGNSITNFVSTGIIINVTPTLITEALADSAGSPEMDFIHMNVQVENSSGQVSPAGPIVTRSTANTQVILLDGEQTVIGGLYSTDETISRRGIPILKDLPGWFFGIRYLTGVTQTTVVQTELVILLQAKLVNPLRARNMRDFETNLLEKRRREVLESLRGLDENAPNEVEFESYFKEKSKQ